MGHGDRRWPSDRARRNAKWGNDTNVFPTDDRPPPFRPRISWVTVLTLLVVWSGVVYVSYLAIDVALNWMASNSSTVLQTGKNAGDTLGVGKEVSATIDRLKNAGFLEQSFMFLRKALVPAVILIWALGAICIVVLPKLLAKIRQFRFGG